MSLTYSAAELGDLALQLSSIEDWLLEKCTARHADDMAAVISKAWRVIEDLYDEQRGLESAH